MYKQLHETISATELVCNLSMLIDKVRFSWKSIYITKGTQTVAELSPPPKEGCSIDKLTELLGALPKLGEDAQLIGKDINKLKETTELPKSPWE